MFPVTFISRAQTMTSKNRGVNTGTTGCDTTTRGSSTLHRAGGYLRRKPPKANAEATEESDRFPLSITSFQQSRDVFVISWNQIKREHNKAFQRSLEEQI